MKENSRKALKMTASILLAVCVLSCSFSVFAVDPTPVPTLTPDLVSEINENLVMTYIWTILKSWGISFSIGGSTDYTGTTEMVLRDFVSDYLEELPSSYDISTWIAPWQAGFDYWGNFQGNSSMLEDVQDFADWLRTKLGLTDNSSIQVVYPGMEMGGYTVYKLPLVIVFETPNKEMVVQKYSADNSQYDVYAMFFWNNPNMDYWFYYMIAEQPAGRITRTIYNNGVAGSTSYMGQNWFDSENYYWFTRGEAWKRTNNSPDNVDPSEAYEVYYFNGMNPVNNGWNSSDAIFKSFLSNYNSMELVGISAFVLTNEMQIPVTGVDVFPGNSITIINNNPQYEDIAWPESVTVDNLPAVIQAGTIEDPQIDQFYDFIPSFIEEAGDSMNFFKQIIFRMPDEVLYCIYAVLASGVIFGFLRILREH